MLQPAEKHPYALTRSLENDQSKCHLGSSFRFYKLAVSCLLSQHPRSAKLQHLQVFHFFAANSFLLSEAEVYKSVA